MKHHLLHSVGAVFNVLLGFGYFFGADLRRLSLGDFHEAGNDGRFLGFRTYLDVVLESDLLDFFFLVARFGLLRSGRLRHA